MIPQIIMIVITLLHLGVTASKDGQLEIKVHNFATTLFAAVISQLLLLWGGFYAPFFK